MASLDASTGAGTGPTILLNDSPLRQSQEFYRLPDEEAGLMTDDEAFYYDRNYSQTRQLFGPIQDAWSSFKRQTGLSKHVRSVSLSSNVGQSTNPRRGLRKFGFILLIALALLGLVQLFSISHSAYIALFPAHRNKVISSWAQIGKPDSGLEHWPTDFTAGVLPIPCHSHNDYWRDVPLYSGLSAGCISTEADVWLEDGELYVGHDESSLTRNRTLASLYLDPLMDILTRQNPATEFVPNGQEGFNGVFDTEPGQVLTLLIDLKTDDKGTFEAVVNALEPLREKGYLTHFDGKRLVERPIRVIGTGNTQFSTVVSRRNPHKDIFMDAAIDDISEESTERTSKPVRRESGPAYTSGNSYYASGSFTDNIGYMWGWSLSQSQLHKLRAQIKGAHSLGLKARYWETPAWPVSRRNALWKILVEEGADILNVDDLKGAVDEDWSRAGRGKHSTAWWFGRDSVRHAEPPCHIATFTIYRQAPWQLARQPPTSRACCSSSLSLHCQHVGHV